MADQTANDRVDDSAPVTMGMLRVTAGGLRATTDELRATTDGLRATTDELRATTEGLRIEMNAKFDDVTAQLKNVNAQLQELYLIVKSKATGVELNAPVIPEGSVLVENNSVYAHASRALLRHKGHAIHIVVVSRFRSSKKHM